MEREITRLKESGTRSPYIVRGASSRRRDSALAGAAILPGNTPGNAPFSPARNGLASPMLRPSRSRVLVPQPMAKVEDHASAQDTDSMRREAAGAQLARQGSLWVPQSKRAHRHY